MTPKEYLTVEKLTEWLKAQEPDTVFEYGSTTDCLMCRYMRAQGFKGVHAGGDYVRVNDEYGIYHHFDNDKLRFATQSLTYGEVLEKLS